MPNPGANNFDYAISKTAKLNVYSAFDHLNIQFKVNRHRFGKRMAAMNNTITRRVAIQARIAEWQRQYRNSNFRPTDFLFGEAKIRADRLAQVALYRAI